MRIQIRILLVVKVMQNCLRLLVTGTYVKWVLLRTVPMGVVGPMFGWYSHKLFSCITGIWHDGAVGTVINFKVFCNFCSFQVPMGGKSLQSIKKTKEEDDDDDIKVR